MTDQQSNPISREILDAAVRRLCRSMASAIVQAMADTDTSLTAIAFRIRQKESTVRDWLQKLIDGECSGPTLHNISDILLAMGCELDFSVRPRTSAEDPSGDVPPGGL
jgi:hypothetical protein